MRPRRFLNLTSSRTLKAKHFKSEVCISTETVEELYDKKKSKINNPIYLKSTLPKGVHY